MSNSGWIKIDRSLQEHWLWQQYPFSYGQAWIDLLMLANWEDKKIVYKGELITCKRGDVNLSISCLAKRWKWHRHTVKSFLDLLEQDGMCTTVCTTHRTVITLVNYEFYQGSDTTDWTTESTTSCQQVGQPVATTKKDKNIKNNKEVLPKGNTKKVFTPPTLDEVIAYCKERGRGVDPDRWFNFYSAKGWMVGKNPMKDWRAAVRTWEKGVSDDGRSAWNVTGGLGE